MSDGPFVVHVARLRRTVGARLPVVCTGPVAGLWVTAAGVPEDAEVTADVTLESVVGGISVVGVVSAPWAGSCRRCLAPTSGVVRVPVRELYTQGGDGGETYPLHADMVDLEPLVRDGVVLELPVAPLCGADCKGLCPSCGANWNEGPCRCEAPPDPRWAALDALRGSDTGS